MKLEALSLISQYILTGEAYMDYDEDDYTFLLSGNHRVVAWYDEEFYKLSYAFSTLKPTKEDYLLLMAFIKYLQENRREVIISEKQKIELLNIHLTYY